MAWQRYDDWIGRHEADASNRVDNGRGPEKVTVVPGYRRPMPAPEEPDPFWMEVMSW